MHRILEILSAILRNVFKLTLIAFFAAFVVCILLVGLSVALLALLWALLRGRKPDGLQAFMRFQRTSRQFSSSVWPGKSAAPAQKDGDVVDVQAREVRTALDDQR